VTGTLTRYAASAGSLPRYQAASADFVTAEAHHARIADIVNSVHPGSAVLRLIDGMDHELGHSGTPEHAYDLHVRQHRSADHDVASRFEFTAVVPASLVVVSSDGHPGGACQS
jgi:hypothetical protein